MKLGNDISGSNPWADQFAGSSKAARQLDVVYMILRSFQRKGTCIACPSDSDCIGIFVPIVSIEWGGKPGKQRYIAYEICNKCAKKLSCCQLEEFISEKVFQELLP